jgi:L-glyceraldehyde 3-phosphate reductase
LNDIAQRRSQTLAQVTLAWALRVRKVTSVLIGASRVLPLAKDVGALSKLGFSNQDLGDIDEHSVDSGVSAWYASSEA